MIRRLFTLLAALSLLLCIATAALWVRSLFVSDRLVSSLFEDDQEWTFWRQSGLRIGLGEIGILSDVQAGPRGQMRQNIETQYSLRGLGPVQRLSYSSSPPERPYTEVAKDGRWGFRWWRRTIGQAGTRPRATGFAVVMPLWPITFLSMTLPSIWIVQWRKRRRRSRLNLCPQCSYDLTANTSGTCPECGSPIS